MHPDRDCDDCGTLHTPWSQQQAAAKRRTADLPSALVLMSEVEKVLAAWDGTDPETAAEVLEEIADQLRSPRLEDR